MKKVYYAATATITLAAVVCVYFLSLEAIFSTFSPDIFDSFVAKYLDYRAQVESVTKLSRIRSSIDCSDEGANGVCASPNATARIVKFYVVCQSSYRSLTNTSLLSYEGSDI